jgi:hypothetical protein
MSQSEIASLDRFIRVRGVALTGSVGGPHHVKRWFLGAGLQAAIGVGALVPAMFAGVFPDVGTAFVGPGAFLLFNSALYLGVAARLQRMARTEYPTGVKLTKEAEEFVRSLITYLDGGSWDRRQARPGGRLTPRRGLLGPRPENRSCEDVLDPAVFQLLTDAAFEYNRIQGSLTLGISAQNATLQRLGPNIRAATDEAMADVLHLAALMEAYPENASRQETKAPAAVEELRELAGQVDRVQTVGDSGAGAVVPGSRLQEVLAELRSDTLAREELALIQVQKGQ